MSTRILGLSFGDKMVQAVEVEQDGPANTLTAIDEWENTLPGGAGENGHGLEEFVEHLSAFIKVNRVKAKQLSIALDSSILSMTTFPMEIGLTRAESYEQTAWELSQYHPDLAPSAFVTDTHVLMHDPDERWSQVLSVAVRRDDVSLFRTAASRLGLTLHVVDVDHFSADTALRVNYPDTRRRFLALVGIKESRLDISMIRYGSMESYSYCIADSFKEIVDQVGALSREAKGIHSITVYGTYLDKELLVEIRRASSLLVEALNPLRHVRVTDSLRLAHHLSVPSYRFAAAVGVALRRD